jgi:predicted glycoside hydrolase/deacetylase ChbG (UPF0249 family)
VADYCRKHPHVEMGVHLTLVSEHDSLRWGPVSACDPSSGLIDDEGYYYRSPQDVQDHGDAAAVQNELRAQVDRALAAGIDVTHLDEHIGVLGHPRFISSYEQVAREYRLPMMMLRLDESGWRRFGLDAERASLASKHTQHLEAQGMPLLDSLVFLGLDHWEDRVAGYMQALSSLPPGVTCFVIAPAHDTPELRAAAERSWRARVADYRAFISEELRDYVRDTGLQLIGYRSLRDQMRSQGT